jgi:dynein heavy chain, axonemal
MSQELLPTPDKSHYTFNLRDLSKLFQGVCIAGGGDGKERRERRRIDYSLLFQLLQVKSITPAIIPRLWTHESMRVFHDRLTNDPDRHTFKLIVCDIVKKHLDVVWSPESLSGLSLLFGDFMRPAVPGMERPYEEITDVAKLQVSLENYLDVYNFDSSANQLKYSPNPLYLPPYHFVP